MLVRLGVPAFVLALSVGVTAAASSYVARTSEARDRLRFEQAVETARDAVQARMRAYVALLHGAAGLFAASREVGKSEFDAYVDRLRLESDYPGIQGLGYAPWIPAADRPGFEARIRRQVPAFRIRPPGDRAVYGPITFLEPGNRMNRPAVGFDMYSEARRREAMDRARDTAAAAASGRVHLVQEIYARKQAGFLIYVPIYRGTRPPETLADRRRLITGFAYSPYRATDLLQAVVPPADHPFLSFEFYDGREPTPDGLLHQSPRLLTHRPRYTRSSRLKVAGRVWTMACASTAAFEAQANRELQGIVLAGGLLISLLLTVVTGAQVRARYAAEEAREALRAANRAKDEFLAMLGHELRNPLAAASNALEVLRVRAPHDPAIQDKIAVALRQIHNQRRMVDDLLDVSRVTSGKITLRQEVLDLRDVTRCAWDAVLAGGEPVEHRMELHLGESPVVVRGDPVRLEQVIVNLLTNARKYTPPGGAISAALEVRPASGGGDAEALLAVRDTGIGIRKELLPCIFETFTQADTSLARARGGLGLGLALVRSLVRMHGGQVEAHSRGPGTGSEFLVRLPALSPERLPAGDLDAGPSAPEHPEAASAAPPGTVLVVDDNRDARETLQDLLEMWGYRVVTASDGPQGLDLALAEPGPDVALIDIGLPGLDGYEVARRVRMRRSRGAPRLVALTGYGQPEDRRRALEAGFDAHLVKPVDPEVLIQALAGSAAKR